MSEEQPRLLLARIAGDPDLKEKLHQAADFDIAAAIAREAGFEVSRESLAALSSASEELSEEELENASGSRILPCLYTANCIKATTGYRTMFAFDCGG